MTVEWRTVQGWDNYEVSNIGQVRVKGKKAAKRTYLKNGYVATQLSRNGFKKAVYIHRLVAAAFCDGDCGLSVNHIDGNRRNNSADNLEWVDASTNTRLMHLRRGHSLKQPVEPHLENRETQSAQQD